MAWSSHSLPLDVLQSQFRTLFTRWWQVLSQSSSPRELDQTSTKLFRDLILDRQWLMRTLNQTTPCSLTSQKKPSPRLKVIASPTLRRPKLKMSRPNWEEEREKVLITLRKRPLLIRRESLIEKTVKDRSSWSYLQEQTSSTKMEKASEFERVQSYIGRGLSS